MRNITFVFATYLLAAFFSLSCEAQVTDLKTFNTLTLYYIDNSEGFDSSPLNSSLNDEVGQEFTKKLNGVVDKPDNYFLLLGCNGSEPKFATNPKSLLASDWVKKYLARTSKEADYSAEKDQLRDAFINTPLRIKKQVDIYLFLSGYAVNQLSRKMEEFPTAVYFPKEMAMYLNNKDVLFYIHLYTNKDVVTQLTPGKIRNYFSLCNAELNLSAFDVEVLPL